eukprot:7376333-Prymnesium_polylepis.1
MSSSAGRWTDDEPSEIGERNVLRDYASSSSTLLVIFGGLMQDIGGGHRAIPPFEFFNLLHRSGIDVKMLFLRDTGMLWYTMGVPGVSGSIGETLDFIRSELLATRATTLVCLGSSMGGYAALLHGLLLRAHQIVAFGPQLYLGGHARAAVLRGLAPAPYEARLDGVVGHLRERWSASLARAALPTASIPLDLDEVLDLSRLLLTRASPATRIDLHVGGTCAIDLSSARRFERDALGRVPLTTHVHADGTHNVVTQLRDAGRLAAILQRHLNDAVAAPRSRDAPMKAPSPVQTDHIDTEDEEDDEDDGDSNSDHSKTPTGGATGELFFIECPAGCGAGDPIEVELPGGKRCLAH